MKARESTTFGSYAMYVSQIKPNLSTYIVIQVGLELVLTIEKMVFKAGL
jgi:hypothetical protein